MLVAFPTFSKGTLNTHLSSKFKKMGQGKIP